MKQIIFPIFASFCIISLSLASPTGLNGEAEYGVGVASASKLDAAAAAVNSVNGLSYSDMVRTMGMQTANKAASDMEAMKMAEPGMNFATSYFGVAPANALQDMPGKVNELKQKQAELAAAPAP